MDNERRRDLEGAGRVLAELATDSKAGVDALLLVTDTLVEGRNPEEAMVMRYAAAAVLGEAWGSGPRSMPEEGVR